LVFSCEPAFFASLALISRLWAALAPCTSVRSEELVDATDVSTTHLYCELVLVLDIRGGYESTVEGGREMGGICIDGKCRVTEAR